MIRRRRRRGSEIAFGLDSFLDVITNVIGIIIRMILVVWISARAYHAVQPQPEPQKMELPPAKKKTISDPLSIQVARQQQELQQLKNQMLEHLRLLPAFEKKRHDLTKNLNSIDAQKKRLERDRQLLAQAQSVKSNSAKNQTVTLSALRGRTKELKKKIAALKITPVSRKAIHYRVPVSKEVNGEELHFEIQYGKVSFIDISSFVREVEDIIRTKADTLRQNGMLAGATRPNGAFRLKYIFKRQAEPLAHLLGDSSLDFQLVVEPISPARGESAKDVLSNRSRFRQIVDHVDPRHTTVTFWVYPDSFALFRLLRDYLHRRDVEVAARPLPTGVPIGMSPRGSTSRGQ